MNDARSAQRLRLIILVILALVAALGSYWLLQVLRQSAPAAPTQQKRGQSDYQVQNFHFVRTAENGQARYLLSGKTLLHYPVDDATEIHAPIAKRVNPNQAPVTIRAERAHLLNNNQHIQLLGNVNITRPASDQAEAMHLKSPSLLIMTENDSMQTDDRVELLFGQSQLYGTGLRANSATGIFQLTHRVHGILQPRPTH